MVDKKFEVGPWDLSSVLPKDVNSKIKEIDALITEYEGWRPKLRQELSREELMSIIKLEERIFEETIKLGPAVYMKFVEDTTNDEASKVKSNVERAETDWSNRMLFFGIWFQKELDDANFERLVKGAGEYEYHLRETRKFKDFTLPEEHEKIINLKDETGSNTRQVVYEKLNSWFNFDIHINGKRKRVKEEELLMYTRGPDQALRSEAFFKLHMRFKEFAPVLGELYIAEVKDWSNENQKLRKYSSPISVFNYANSIPDEAVDALLSSCRENKDIFQKYFLMKSKLCGIEGKISRTDIYAPIKESSEKKFSFDQAIHMVLDNYASFSPKMAQMANSILEEKHVHSQKGKNKQGGAFCCGMPKGIAPFVFINYDETLRSAFVLAHEIGHGVHDLLSAEKHGPLTFYAPTPLAETASVFSEMMLSDRLMVQAGDDKVLKKEMLANLLDDNYGTLIRQAYFTIFEKQAHEMINSPEGASIEQLSSMYLDTLKEQFGDSLELPDYFRYEWMRIPHLFRTPFYCYSYAFGNLLTLSLFQEYKQQGKAFVPKYEKLLAGGGSASPDSILKEVGIDMRSKSFWQGGFDILREKVEELERLM